MKPSRLVAALAAVAAIAAIISLRGRTAEVRSTSSIAREAQAAERPSAGTAPAPSAAEKKEAAPEIVFLEEGGGMSSSGRPRPTTFRIPEANGTRRVVNARPVTTPEQGEFVSPRWSPDGLELLVSRPGYMGLFTVGSNGGEITQLTAKEGIGFGADWNEQGEIETRTNSGERQKFNPDGTPVDSVSVAEDPTRTGAFAKDDTIYYRPAPGEAPVPLTGGEDRYFGAITSPDGKYVAYNGLHTGVYVQPVDGSSPPVHISAGVSPRWLPDSSGIVYTATTDDGHNLLTGDLYAATVDGQTISNLTQTENSIEQNPSVSPDGTRIAFEADGQIYVGELQ